MKVFKIFLCYANDAKEQIKLIKKLEKDINDYIVKEVNIFNQSPLFSYCNIFEWKNNVPLTTGGQSKKINPYINDADLLIFIFKSRIGKVTQDEVDLARKLNKNIICLFPNINISTEIIKREGNSFFQKFAELEEYKKSLTKDWNDKNLLSISITPVNEYDNENLKENTLNNIKRVIKSYYETEKIIDYNLDVETIISDELQIKNFLTGKRKNNPTSQFYWKRKTDDEIMKYLSSKDNIMVIGNSLLGKTKAVFESLNKLENIAILIIKNHYKLDKIYVDNGVIVFFDDINEFMSKNNIEATIPMNTKISIKLDSLNQINL